MLILLLALGAQPLDTTAVPPSDPAPVTPSRAAEPPAAPPSAVPSPTPPAADAPRQCTLAVLDLEGGDAMAPARARALSDVVTGEVSALSPCAALSRSDIRGILSLEAEKQLMGCASDSCMAELAGALGADFLVNGTVSRIEGSVLLSLRMTDMKTLKVVRRATDSFAGDDADAIPFVAWLSRKLMTDDPQVVGVRPVAAVKASAPVQVVKQSTVWRPIFWTSLALTGAAGVITGAAGGATGLMSDAAKDNFSAADSLQDIGPVTADVANVGLYATSVFFVATIVLFFFPAEEVVTQ